MKQHRYSYRIYPSLLDKFNDFLNMKPEDAFVQDIDGNWHRNYNETTGEYILTDEEFYERSKKSLIDSINRVRTASEAACRGTVFNEVVDSFINKKRSEKVKMVGRRDDDTLNTEYEENGKMFNFCFSLSFVEEVAQYFNNSINQVLVSSTLETRYGDVELYGYIDELRGNKVYDIKTTKEYTFGKYKNGWQKEVYPYCLVESGMCTDIQSFEYTCYVLKGGTSRSPIITGVQYPEVYVYEHEKSRQRIKEFCERFIEFLEENRELITDKKIFGGENS